MQGIIDGRDLDQLHRIDRTNSHDGEGAVSIQRRATSEMTASELALLEFTGLPSDVKRFPGILDEDNSASTSASVPGLGAAAASVSASTSDTVYKSASGRCIFVRGRYILIIGRARHRVALSLAVTTNQSSV